MYRYPPEIPSRNWFWQLFFRSSQEVNYLYPRFEVNESTTELDEETDDGQREGPSGSLRQANEQRQTYILKEAGVDLKPGEDRGKLLKGGVDYKDKKKRYWVDKQERNCFKIYPRGLNIALGDRPECWQWTGNGNQIEMAELVRTKWLEVGGSFWTTGYLSHEVNYKVSLLVRSTLESNLKRQTVTLKLCRPDGTLQEGQAKLPESEQRKELEVGQFYMTEKNAGEVRFAMEQSFEKWMKGLIIEGVEIKAM